MYKQLISMISFRAKRFIVVTFALIGFGASAFSQNTVTESDPLKLFSQDTLQEEMPQVAIIDPNEDIGQRIMVNRWHQNWEFSGRVGTQGYMGEYCLDVFRLKDWWVMPAVDFTVSKWGTRAIGLSAGFTYSPFKSLYLVNGKEDLDASFAKSTDKVYGPNSNFKVATGSMGNIYASMIVNLTDVLFGFNPQRFCDIEGTIGGGMIFPLSENKYKKLCCSSFNAALISKINLSRHLSFDVSVRGTLHDDWFNGVNHFTSGDENNLSVDATIGLTAGLSYKFDFLTKGERKSGKKRVNNEGWTTVNEVVTYTQPYKKVEKKAEVAQANANVMAVALVDANKKIDDFNDRGPKILKDTVIFYNNVTYRQLVNFKIDTWDITNREKINILFASQFMKANPKYKFGIFGYADKQTSNPEHNQMLSEKRCEAVYKMLINEFGVNPDQLVITASGGVDYMFFNDPQCSRSVEIYALLTDEDD